MNTEVVLGKLSYTCFVEGTVRGCLQAIAYADDLTNQLADT